MQGKLATIIDRIEHSHHVFRAYFKHAFLKQYEKFSTFLRNELVSNNLADFRLKKGSDHLDAIRERFQTITGRFAAFQAQWLNVHVDFPAPAPCPPGHRRRGPLSRHQDPRPPSHPPPRGPLARRHSGWRLDRQANPPHRPHQLPPLRQCLRPEPAALRSTEAQRPPPATAATA